MTMHTWTTYRCTCGHVGAVHPRENDQPFSENWEHTRLEGLKGSEQAPRCGNCSKVLRREHEVAGKPRDYGFRY